MSTTLTKPCSRYSTVPGSAHTVPPAALQAGVRVVLWFSICILQASQTLPCSATWFSCNVHFILRLVDSRWTSLSIFVLLFGLPSTIFFSLDSYYYSYFIDLSLKCGSHSLQFTTRGGSDYGVEKSWFMEKKEKNYSTVYTVTEEPRLSLSVRGQGCSTASTEFIYTRMDTSILHVSLCIDITLLSPQLQIDSGWNQNGAGH